VIRIVTASERVLDAFASENRVVNTALDCGPPALN
jgi:hypothetical protein